jgi:hypothetical protein
MTRRGGIPLAAASDIPIETEDQEVWAFVDATFELKKVSGAAA